MNAYGRIEGAALRQRMTYSFEMPPPRSAAVDLNYVRATGLAQMRLQLAVLSGNRRGALRELDRLVEIDRQLEALASPAGTSEVLPGASLIAQLDEQREAIATEKLALMAAIEFPRLAPADRVEAEPHVDDDAVVLEDVEFAPRLVRAFVWLAGAIGFLTVLVFALMALTML